MKSSHLLIVVLLSTSIAFAQEWVDPGATQEPISLPGIADDLVETNGEAPKSAEPSVPSAGTESASGVYEVQKGDTLWGLAADFYKNPFDWKRIWEGNKTDIRNPNLIYPHQKFRIPGAASATAQKTPEGPDAEDPVDEEIAEEPLSAALVGESVSALDAAAEGPTGTFVADKNWSGDGQIIGDVNKQIMIGQNDFVFVNLGAASGVRPKMRANVYRRGQRVRNPESGERLGYVMRRVGIIEMTKDIQDESSLALVIRSYEPIKKGDFIRLKN